MPKITHGDIAAVFLSDVAYVVADRLFNVVENAANETDIRLEKLELLALTHDPALCEQTGITSAIRLLEYLLASGTSFYLKGEEYTARVTRAFEEAEACIQEALKCTVCGQVEAILNDKQV